jgi:hypothetical protein
MTESLAKSPPALCRVSRCNVCANKSLSCCLLLLFFFLRPNNLNLPKTDNEVALHNPQRFLLVHLIRIVEESCPRQSLRPKSPLSSLDPEGRQSGSAQREFHYQSLLLDDDIQSDQNRPARALALTRKDSAGISTVQSSLSHRPRSRAAAGWSRQFYILTALEFSPGHDSCQYSPLLLHHELLP